MSFHHLTTSTNNTSVQSLAGLAIRHPEIHISEPVPFPFSNSAGQRIYDDENQKSLQRLEGNWPRKSAPSAMYGEGLQIKDPNHTRISTGPSIITSTMSSVPSHSSLIQKRNAGFRATIRRMFGSKKYNSSLQDSHKDSQKYSHRSDPGNLTSCQETTQALDKTSFKLSRPRHRVIHAPALGSHAPTPRQQISAWDPDRILPMHKRRNTLPSLLLSEADAQAISAHIANTGASVGFNEGGDAQQQLNRRSRSADALTEMMHVPQTDISDRPDRDSEIAYWRNSIVVNPLPSIPVPSNRSFDQRPSGEQRRSQPKPSPSLRPLQSFDFGLHDDPDHPATLERRVDVLEVKMVDFEYAIARLQGIDLPRPDLLNKTVRKSPSYNTTTFLDTSSNDMEFSKSSDPSLVRSSELSSRIQSQRASKATTVRPISRNVESRQPQSRSRSRSQTSYTSSTRITSQQYKTLLDLVQDEKAARQQMEMQLMELQKEVELLQAPVYASIRSANYPTPSPESYHEGFISPRAKPLHRAPAFQVKRPTTNHETSRFSMTESENASDAGEIYEEIYETPREDRFRFETSRASQAVDMF